MNSIPSPSNDELFKSFNPSSDDFISFAHNNSTNNHNFLESHIDLPQIQESEQISQNFPIVETLENIEKKPKIEKTKKKQHFLPFPRITLISLWKSPEILVNQGFSLENCLILGFLKEILWFSLSWCLTVGLFPLLSNIKEEGILNISIKNPSKLKDQAYFNVISGIFLIFLLILLRIRSREFINNFQTNYTLQEKTLKIANLPIYKENYGGDSRASDENIEKNEKIGDIIGKMEKHDKIDKIDEKLIYFFNNMGFSINKVSLIYDSSEILALEMKELLLNDEIIEEKQQEAVIFLEEKLIELKKRVSLLKNNDIYKQEKFLGKAYVTFSKIKGIFSYLLILIKFL